jgi:hypothetical protein
MLNPKHKSFAHWIFGIWKLFAIWCLVLVIFPGCASIKETAKGIAAISTKALEDNRKDAVKKTFNYDYKTSYNKVKDILTETGSYIYAQNPKKHLIAIYVSATDTTAAGIFFKEIDAAHTQIEVSSLSTYAKELIAKRISSALLGLNKAKEKEGTIHEKK